jgi:hypothetical protein
MKQQLVYGIIWASEKGGADVREESRNNEEQKGEP